MDIPDDVKRKAMDAVSHRETTAFMRAHGFSDAPPFYAPALRAGEASQTVPVSEDARRQAMDAVANRETTAQIRLVRDSGAIVVPQTPSRESARAAERITEMHRSGVSVEAVQRHMTRDNFERTYD